MVVAARVNPSVLCFFVAGATFSLSDMKISSSEWVFSSSSALSSNCMRWGHCRWSCASRTKNVHVLDSVVWFSMPESSHLLLSLLWWLLHLVLLLLLRSHCFPSSSSCLALTLLSAFCASHRSLVLDGVVEDEQVAPMLQQSLVLLQVSLFCRSLIT